MVRRNGGAVSRMSSAEWRWVGELSRDLRERLRSGASGAHPEEAAVPSPGHTVPEGSGCADDAGAGADIRGGPAAGAVCIPAGTKREGRGAYRGHNEVVDADLSNYFGEIPHAELMKSIARRVSDGRMLGLIAWLEMPVIEEDGASPHEPGAEGEKGDSARGSDLTAAEQHLHAAVSLAGRCWAALRCGDRELRMTSVCSTAEMLAAVNRLMDRLKLPVNAEKTRLRCPEEPLEFLGYRIGWDRSGNGSRSLDRARRAFRASATGSASRRTADVNGWMPRKS